MIFMILTLYVFRVFDYGLFLLHGAMCAVACRILWLMDSVCNEV